MLRLQLQAEKQAKPKESLPSAARTEVCTENSLRSRPSALDFFEAPQKRFVTPKNPPGIEKYQFPIPQKRASLFLVKPKMVWNT
eukprot:4352673-Prymnesium_polylepis.1